MTVTAPPFVAEGDHPTGHLDGLRRDPIGLMQRSRAIAEGI